MNRRDFFRLTGLGAGSLFLAPAVLSAPWTEEWEAQEAVKYAVEVARAHGAEYVDARIGPCEVIGRYGAEGSVDLLQRDLLGMRICTSDGWRMIVMRDWGREAIGESLPLAVGARGKGQGASGQGTGRGQRTGDRGQDGSSGETWVAAQFCREKVLAHLSTDPVTESQLNTAWLRFGTRPPLPADSTQFRFCDILLHQ